MKALLTTRWYYGALLATCLGLLGFGLFLQHFQDLEPCPLCIFQRIAYLTIAAIAAIGLVHGYGKLSSRIYGTLMAAAALAGGAIAGRQVWMEYLPPEQVPACGPGLDYMLDTFPLSQVLKMVLRGSGECAEVLWRFLGLSIAEWSLIWFVLFALAGLLPFLAGRYGQQPVHDGRA